MARWLYNGILLLLSPLLLLYLLRRFLSGKSREGWAERWGNLNQILPKLSQDSPRLWIHAVSAGEVVAAVPILKELRIRFPHHTFLFSVITPAGHEMASQQATPFIDALFYSPFDFPFVVKRVVRTLRPETFVSLESEMWPNLLDCLKRNGCRTVMVNGRVSERSFQRSLKVAWLYRWAIGNIDRLLVQSEADAHRIGTLGGISESAGKRVEVLGNSKFDQALRSLSPEEVSALRSELKFPPDSPIFVVGSTRSPEEEAVIFDAYQQMQHAFPDLCLLVAPRQIDRAEEVQAAMQRAGLQPIRRTQLESAIAPVRHLILDTMGELANVYAVAVFAYVGNSLPPVVKGGGQNLLQPLAHGKPVLFGTHTATIRSEVQLTSEAGVGFMVQNAQEIAERGLEFLRNPEVCETVGRRAKELMAQQRGVSARYADAILLLSQQQRETTP